MFKIYLFIMSALVAAQVAALPTGAPVSACTTMSPFHVPFFKAQQGIPPVTLTVSSQQTSSRTPIKVTLQTDGTTSFKGYLIEARSGGSHQAIGTFVAAGENNSGKTINCPGGVANAVTHTSRAAKTSETFSWTPPAKFKGNVIMTATVVVNYAVIYKGVQSSVITVKKKV